MMALKVSGQIREGSDGLFYSAEGMLYSGVLKENYPSGSLKAEFSINEGKHNGKASLYYENRIMSEMRSYRDGKKDGTWISWSEKGIKIGEANYQNDKKHGKWYIWDESGILRYDMTYNQGRKTGIWIMWDEKGNEINRKEQK